MKAAKAWMALGMSLFIGGIGTALSLGLVPNNYQPLAVNLTVLATAIGTTIGVYKIPNAPADPLPPKHLNRTIDLYDQNR